jgi:hypothetical protein
MPRSKSQTSLWLSLCLLGGVFGPGFVAVAADDQPVVPAAPPKPAADRLAPAEVVKPVVPGKAELAESAFKKLDVTGKGYVTREDTSGLEGFGRVFENADSDHSGKLDFRQFKKAWAEYTGYKDKE